MAPAPAPPVGGAIRGAMPRDAVVVVVAGFRAAVVGALGAAAAGTVDEAPDDCRRANAS